MSEERTEGSSPREATFREFSSMTFLCRSLSIGSSSMKCTDTSSEVTRDLKGKAKKPFNKTRMFIPRIAHVKKETTEVVADEKPCRSPQSGLFGEKQKERRQILPGLDRQARETQLDFPPSCEKTNVSLLCCHAAITIPV